MTNNFDSLKLYTSNPKQINSMLFYFNGKICGRCLIWKCDDGKDYHDRLYYNNDWAKPYMEELLKKNDIKSAKSKKLTVTLDKISFNRYPYMDTFIRKDIKSKQLSNQ